MKPSLTTIILASLCTATTTPRPPPFDTWPHLRVALPSVSIHARYSSSGNGTGGPPVLLVHGNPQHSLTWHAVAPLLAARGFTVLAPDNRGAGDSSIPPDGNYTAAASAGDLKGVLDFLNVSAVYVVGHDKGAGMAVALAAKYPGLVRRLAVAEYVLPGFGYEEAQVPREWWDLYANWQLAFFSVPEAAEFFIRGREREMLEWYFFHGSYSGNEGFEEGMVEKYARSIGKPGFLRAMLGPFDNKVVTEDRSFFRGMFAGRKLGMPVLALGGEASFGPAMEQAFGNVSERLETDVVPKAGHWLADENPTWVANRLARFLVEDPDPLPDVDLSYLADKATLTVSFYGTLGNAALGEAESS